MCACKRQKLTFDCKLLAQKLVKLPRQSDGPIMSNVNAFIDYRQKTLFFVRPPATTTLKAFYDLIDHNS